MNRAFLIAAVVASLALAQQTVFRSAVDLVHLDVSVLDKDRNPVRNLTAAAFSILEDGQPRPVAAFAALSVKPQVQRTGDSWTQRVAADVQTNEIARAPEGRLFVLLLDDGLTPNDPQAIKTTRQIAETMVDRMSPADRMAVVFTVGSKGTQNFTNDRERLLKAASTFTPGYARHLMGWDTAIADPDSPPGQTLWSRTADSDDGYRAGSVRTLESVAESLIAAPQRRKAIVFVSPGVFVDPESAAAVVAIRSGQSMMIHQGNSALLGRLPPLYRRMREANVTIYAIDPTGLGGLEAYIQRAAAGVPAMGSATVQPPGADWFTMKQPPFPDQLARRIASIERDFLKEAASNTGGLAITDTNDLVRGVDRIFSENDAYYLLGFAIPAGHRAGSQHRIEVRVNRPGTTVRTRSGYAVPAVTPAPDAGAAAPGEVRKPASTATTAALAGPVPSGPLPMRVAIAPLAAAPSDKGDAVVAIALGFEHTVTTATAQTFEVEVRAFSPDGAGKLAERRTGQATLRPAPPGGSNVFDLLFSLPLAPGRYELRFGALLRPLDLAGGLFADVEVPDFKEDPLSLSGVLMSTPETNGGPVDAFKGVLPVVPTSVRTFTPRQSPQAFVRVYQGGRNPLSSASMRVTVHDRNNQLVFNNRFPLPVARFDSATRAADFTFAPVAGMFAPGPYLLTFEAQLGSHSAKRQVRFEFR